MEKHSTVNIVNLLEQMIFDGTFADGDRLDEVRLAKQFGVSRTPLREALQRLASSGLVALIPRRGAFVRQPGPLELLNMFEVMAELEAVCSRLATQRISEVAINELKQANAGCKAALKAQDPDLYYAENEKFHTTLYRESGNSFLEQESLKLQKRLSPFRRQQLRLRGRMSQSLKEHESIISALISGDSNLAANATREHVAVQGERFHSLIANLKSAAS